MSTGWLWWGPWSVSWTGSAVNWRVTELGLKLECLVKMELELELELGLELED